MKKRGIIRAFQLNVNERLLYFFDMICARIARTLT